MVISFDRDEIESALEELVEDLVAQHASSHIRIVGGAAIAIRFHRDTTTTDVDALFGRDPRVEAAARQIARTRGWPDTWLNEDVQMWTSHFDGPDDWEPLLARDEVTVKVASAPLLLAMKLRAARGRRDAADIEVLLDACEVTSLAEVTELYERYYPEDEMGPRAHAQLERRFGSSP